MPSLQGKDGEGNGVVTVEVLVVPVGRDLDLGVVDDAGVLLARKRVAGRDHQSRDSISIVGKNFQSSIMRVLHSSSEDVVPEQDLGMVLAIFSMEFQLGALYGDKSWSADKAK